LLKKKVATEGEIHVSIRRLHKSYDLMKKEFLSVIEGRAEDLEPREGGA